MDNCKHEKELTGFLIKYQMDQLRSIILSPDPRLHYPLYVDFAELLDDKPSLAHLVFSNPTEYLIIFYEAALWAQKVIFDDLKSWPDASVKSFVHVRIDVAGSPLECPETFPSIGRVRVKHRGILLTLKGTVIRSGTVKMIEGEKTYECRTCKTQLLHFLNDMSASICVRSSSRLMVLPSILVSRLIANGLMC